MEPGGFDIERQVPPGTDALPFIIAWWGVIWPDMVVEPEDSHNPSITETFLWRSAASQAEANYPYTDLVQVLVGSDWVNLCVDDPHQEQANLCLDDLLLSLSKEPSIHA